MRFFTLLVLILSSSCSLLAATNSSWQAVNPPEIPREFRAAWIAVFSNIDWPSKPGLSVDEQKAELKALIQKAAELRLNALIFQVRPACDAVYNSSIEPWTEFLNGQMGRAPSSPFDPLKFAIDEAHARGLELHAWFNPYRAGLIGRPLSSKHIRKTQPNLVRTYGKYLWLDPGEPAVQSYTTKVILDVVRRYDIDGVHLDDYFYPYPESGDFPDQPSWNRYRNSGGKLKRDDWRRENVNRLVRSLQAEIGRQKPWVTFGISPFGIWRPGFPAQIKGLDAYGAIYADARLWLAKGWVDYIAPQLYWPSTQRGQSYPVLLDWWESQSTAGRPVWPGGALHLAKTSGSGEIVRQIELTRQSSQPGYIHWSFSQLVVQAELQKEIRKLYGTPALVPINPGDKLPVPKPQISGEKKFGDQFLIRWKPGVGSAPAKWVLQIKRGGIWETKVFPAHTKSELLNMKNVTAVTVTALNRHRAASLPAVFSP